ncbi:MAG: hypothetical protein M1829_004176 [Trizodia sp. TS-e1964]|nr:MAG: hypothetical protein M1829_004176 [Trizodia sp. TS-e1964]
MARLQIPIDVLTSRLNLSNHFDSIRSTSLASRFSNLKPVSEFLDVKRISKPANFSEVQTRVNYNLSYFSSNYFAVFIMLSIYSLITNIALLFDIIAVCGGLYGIRKLEGQDLHLGLTRLTTQQLYTILLVITIPIGIYASPISTALWLIGASGVSIIGHASFMDRGGLGGRPRTPKPTPLWGRPSGGRRRDREWERFKQREEEVYRFEEVDSEDDGDNGVDLNFARSGRRIASDELHFTGIDMASRPQRGNRFPFIENSGSSDDDGEDSDSMDRASKQIVLRGKEDSLVQSAMDRIRRAQQQGYQSVDLTESELEALDNKNRSGNSSSLSIGKTRPSSGGSERQRKRAERPSDTPPSAPRRRSKESNFGGDSPTYPPPGFAIFGPNGAPAYSPLTYYPVHAGSSPSSRPSSRSASAQHLPAQNLPPYPQQHYPLPPYYQAMEPPPPSRQQPTPPHRSPIPHQGEWAPRARATSTPYAPYPLDPFQYQTYSPPLPPDYGPARRGVSGPAEVQYASLRRGATPSGYDHGGQLFDAAADPAPARRRAPRFDGTESENGDEEGAFVDASGRPLDMGSRFNTIPRRPLPRGRGGY